MSWSPSFTPWVTSQELLARVEQIGTRTTYTCPECNGTLWQVQTDELPRFRCHVGHAYTAEAWEGAQTEENSTERKATSLKLA